MYNAWTELGADGILKNSILDGLKQPKTITITFTIGSNQNAKEHKVFVIPNQGKFGVEWTLAHTYPDFVKNVLLHFTIMEREEPGFQAKCFELWGMLVQGNALTAWSMVVAEHFDTDKKKNAASAFKHAIALYLESLVGLKYIGDQVICQLCEQKNPAMMPYCNFKHHHRQLLLYVMQYNLLRNCVSHSPRHTKPSTRRSLKMLSKMLTSFAPSLKVVTLKMLPMASFKS